MNESVESESMAIAIGIVMLFLILIPNRMLPRIRSEHARMERRWKDDIVGTPCNYLRII